MIEIEGILMTMYDGRTNLAEQVVAEVRKHFGDKVYQTVIPRNVRLSEAPSHGIPVIQYDASSNGAKAYRLLAAEFLARLARIENEGQVSGVSVQRSGDGEQKPKATEQAPAPADFSSH
jgi:cellulose biosynthesis protein BcsQ